MPNYTYACARCGLEYVLQRRIAERDAPVACGCNAPLARKLEAPALKDFAGSHRDEYTKTGPRK